MNFLEKIQNLPVGKRKFILWFLLAIIALLLFSLYMKNVSSRLKNLNADDFKKGLNVDKLKEGFNQLPKMQTPRLEIPATSTPETSTPATGTEESASSASEIILN
jgi:hypothetical protein